MRVSRRPARALVIFLMRALAVIAALGLLNLASPLFGDDSLPPQQTKLGTRDWSVNASANLVRHPPSKKSVEAFVRALEFARDGESLIGDPDGGVVVCSFRFADLRRNGTLSLVYGEGNDQSSRYSCRDVWIVDRTPAGFVMYSGGGEVGAGADVGGQLEDLKHDGKLEFIEVDSLGEIEHRCLAQWEKIYTWTGNSYSEVGDQFKDFYRKRLDKVEKILPALQDERGDNGYASSDKDCLEAEAAALKRFLGISSDAGMDQAARLATSNDHFEREFATELLAEMGTPTAREYLEKLAKDNDWMVSTYAKHSLARKPSSSSPSFTAYPPLK